MHAKETRAGTCTGLTAAANIRLGLWATAKIAHRNIRRWTLELLFIWIGSSSNCLDCFFVRNEKNSKLSIINICENFKRLKLFNVQESFQNLFNTITYWTLKPSEILCLECLRVLHWMLFTLIIQFKFTNFSYEKQVGLGKKKKIYFNFLKFRYRFF